MTYINLTGITDANTTLEIIKIINVDLTDGFFSLLLIIAFMVILLINNAGDFRDTFLLTSFIISIVAGMLWLAGLVSLIVMLGSILIVFIAILLYFFLT